MNRFNLPNLGYGMGLRTVHYPYVLENWPEVGWFEVISENFMDTGGRPVRILKQIRERYPVVMHGVSMSIGSSDPLDKEYLKKLKKLAGWLNPPWISDHLCWTGIAHTHTHDLLPMPYTEEALRHIVQRIREVQDYLERPLLLENPSTYLEFNASQMSESEFIARMAEEADCALLLDANNIYVSCYNHRLDPKEYIDNIPMDRVVQIHLAGHDNRGTHIIDTHDNHIIDEVWQLYHYIISKTGAVSTMVEWDDNIPEFEVVKAEVDKARAFVDSLDIPNNLPEFNNNSTASAAQGEMKLSSLQSGMQDAILSADIEQAQPDKWIKPKPEFAPQDQLYVYINGYRYRLYDILLEDLPVLSHYLGDEKISEILNGYIESTPSTNFNVARYISKLSQYIKVNSDNILAHEIAELEVGLSQIFDMKETAPLKSENVEDATPEQLLNMTLAPRDALKLYRFSYPVNKYYQAVLDEENPSSPEPESTYLAAYRHEDKIWRMELAREEYELLNKLSQKITLGEAFEQLLEQIDGDNDNDSLNIDEISNNLQNWFSRWISNGLLSRV